MKWRVTLVLAVVAVWSVGWALALAWGCAQAGPAAVATFDTALCILAVYTDDTQAGKDVAGITADAIAKCGADAATVARTLDAQRKAEVAHHVADSEALIQAYCHPDGGPPRVSAGDAGGAGRSPAQP